MRQAPSWHRRAWSRRLRPLPLFLAPLLPRATLASPLSRRTVRVRGWYSAFSEMRCDEVARRILGEGCVSRMGEP